MVQGQGKLQTRVESLSQRHFAPELVGTPCIHRLVIRLCLAMSLLPICNSNHGVARSLLRGRHPPLTRPSWDARFLPFFHSMNPSYREQYTSTLFSLVSRNLYSYLVVLQFSRKFKCNEQGWLRGHGCAHHSPTPAIAAG